VTQQNSKTVASGSVISQDPAGGSSVIEGSQVALVISQGAGPPRISFQLTTTSLVACSGKQRHCNISRHGDQQFGYRPEQNATNLFFNFFDFSAESVTPSQDLGIMSNFVIPNGTISAVVNLFEVQVGSVPAGSSFQIQVQLEDANSDLSATQTVLVSTPP
jgi:PASTA domain